MNPGDVDSPAGPAEHTHFLERWGWAGAFALLTLGFILRVRGLSTYWLNPDEGIYYSALTRTSFGDFWADVIANAHPPAFYLLLRGLGLFTWDFVWLSGTSVLFGGPSERILGARPLVTNEVGEQVIRRQDLASLVVERLGPEGAPRTILMSEQTYNLMMPLYPSAREDVRMSDDSALLTFSYGAREIVVARRWVLGRPEGR